LVNFDGCFMPTSIGSSRQGFVCTVCGAQPGERFESHRKHRDVAKDEFARLTIVGTKPKL
jgi:hypothetical protein